MSFSKTRSSTLNKSMCFYPQLTEFPPSSSSFRRRQSQLIKVGRCFSFQLLAQLISTFVGWTLHLVIYANESSFYAFHHLSRVSTSLYKAFFSTGTFNKSPQLSINTHGFGVEELLLACSHKTWYAYSKQTHEFYKSRQ